MQDHKLKVFCTVAETKSFSKASEIIRLTQPAVSLQIQALEEIYGAKLFNRSGCIITLTPAGELLYKYAKDINTLYADADREIGKITGLVKGIVTLGASSTIGNYVMPTVISDFRKKFPKVNVHLLISNTKTIVEYLNAAGIDVGFVEGDVVKQKLLVEKIVSDEMVIIMPPLHAWAKRPYVSISELTREPFIIREEGSGTRQIIEKYLTKHGIHPQNIKTTLTFGSTESIKSAVENGLGVSIISRWAAKKETRYGSLKTATFKEDRFVRDFSLLRRKTKSFSHSLDSFLVYLKSYPFDKLLNS
ncbi:MAG: LysR family transcriptional regulator [Nitrospirae bacterium]|nr:LysR family transcriptional regulator [Nitrospirota bacterium]